MKNILVLYGQGNKKYWKNGYENLDVNNTIALSSHRRRFITQHAMLHCIKIAV